MVEPGQPAEFGQEIIQRRHRLATALTDFSGRKILDFGCGNGAQTAAFIEPGCRITAVDVSASRIADFKGYLATNGLSGVTPLHYAGKTLPFNAGAFDLVMSYDVLEHVQDEEASLAELQRVLRPGGDLLISVPNKWWIFETHGAYLPLLPWNRVPFFSWLPGPLHRRWARAHIYTRRRITRLLERHGLEIAARRYITAPLDVLNTGMLKRLLQRLVFRGDTTRVPFLATSILLLCRKPA